MKSGILVFRLTLLASIAQLSGGCFDLKESAPSLIELRGNALATTWTVKLLTTKSVNMQDVKKAIEQRLEANEKIFSHWRKDALLYQFNKTKHTEPIVVDSRIYKLLKHANWMHQNSAGAFDPAIGHLVNIWGFGPDGKNRTSIPPEEQIEKARQTSGMNQLKILPEKMVRKNHPTLQLDLSGSAKGEIIDQICQLLDRYSFGNYLVEIGGEIRAEGKGRKGNGWVVGLEDGLSKNENGMTSVPLRNYAVATSGSYRLTKPNPGSNRNASHLIDPRTGRPIEHDLIAVNAFAPTARDADAWATALMILGPEEGMKMAEKMDMVARFCILKDDEFLILKSTAYDRIFTKLPTN